MSASAATKTKERCNPTTAARCRKGPGNRLGRSLAGAFASRRRRSAQVGGFTLFEVLLTLALLTLLVGVSVLALGGTRRQQAFQEGVLQFRGLCRRLAAEAAHRREVLRLRFTDLDERTDGARPWVVEAETDALDSPGQFEPIDAPWTRLAGGAAVRVTRCRLMGQAAYRRAALAASEGFGGLAAAAVPDPLTFRPDGSADEAVVELAGADGDDDPRRALWVIHALPTDRPARFVHVDDLEDAYEQLAEELGPEVLPE